MPDETEDRLVIVAIPPLVVLIKQLEKIKGSPLSQEEVETIRDNAVCMRLPQSVARQMAKTRGYEDIDPANVWVEWQAVRDQIRSGI